uniref:Pheromone n=2 Tax=Malassezia sympodialis TaxID=76777 RepID=L7S1N0_MALSM|nr:pheromone [Malassezia sympodialis]
MNPIKQTQNKINSTDTNMEDKGESKDTKPVNYEWPPTPEPNPTYLCVIA